MSYVLWTCSSRGSHLTQALHRGGETPASSKFCELPHRPTLLAARPILHPIHDAEGHRPNARPVGQDFGWLDRQGRDHGPGSSPLCRGGDCGLAATSSPRGRRQRLCGNEALVASERLVRTCCVPPPAGRSLSVCPLVGMPPWPQEGKPLPTDEQVGRRGQSEPLGGTTPAGHFATQRSLPFRRQGDKVGGGDNGFPGMRC